MIYITGDTHSDFTRFSRPRFPEQKQMTKDDIVIILGDFGGVWNIYQDSAYEKWWLKWLEDKPFTICFVDGNHENYDRLDNDYPEIDFHDGKAHQIRENVFHLMRGYVFDFEGKKFFCMGGARSHDIRDGIFDVDNYKTYKSAKDALNRWYKNKKEFRIKGYSWWEQEIPDQIEMNRGIENLDKVDWNVDYVITHCLPTSVALALGYKESDPLTSYLEDLLLNNLKFHRWYCGHYHTEKTVWGKFIVKYEDIERII